MANLYVATPQGANASAQGTVVAVAAATLKTHIQVTTPSTRDIFVSSWWIEFDGSAAAVPIKVDLANAAAITATVTSLAPQKYDLSADAPASLCVGGTSATGFNASAEGTIVAGNVIECHHVPQTAGLYVQYTPGINRPYIPVSANLRLRTLVASGTPNAMQGIVWEE